MSTSTGCTVSEPGSSEPCAPNAITSASVSSKMVAFEPSSTDQNRRSHRVSQGQPLPEKEQPPPEKEQPPPGEDPASRQTP